MDMEPDMTARVRNVLKAQTNGLANAEAGSVYGHKNRPVTAALDSSEVRGVEYFTELDRGELYRDALPNFWRGDQYSLLYLQ